jgi:hypothetical protein
VCLTVAGLHAQPDPSQMSGIPRPDPNLVDGSITVRVIRGTFANNVVGLSVELRAGDTVSSVDTDAEGRATFTSLSPGSQVTVATTLDGDALESQSFVTPGRGGVAVLLVGVSGTGGDAMTSPPARQGRVTFGQDSRILVELGEENVEVYYLLDVMNVANEPIDPETAFEFTLPPGAQAGTVLQGSSPRTIIDDQKVLVTGGFTAGVTPVRIAYVMPYSTGSLVLSQVFPADFDQLLVFIEQWGAIDVASTLIERRGEMAADEAGGGKPLLWAAGGRALAGLPLVLELSGLPHHSGWPRIIALSLSGLIVAVSVWGAKGTGGSDVESQRLQEFTARREKLFADLVKIERQHRQGKVGATRYRTRRAELVDELVDVFRVLNEGLVPEVVIAAASAPSEATA